MKCSWGIGNADNFNWFRGCLETRTTAKHGLREVDSAKYRLAAEAGHQLQSKRKGDSNSINICGELK